MLEPIAVIEVVDTQKRREGVDIGLLLLVEEILVPYHGGAVWIRLLLFLGRRAGDSWFLDNWGMDSRVLSASRSRGMFRSGPGVRAGSDGGKWARMQRSGAGEALVMCWWWMCLDPSPALHGFSLCRCRSTRRMREARARCLSGR